MKYDLVIIGGGPIGIACAIEAKARALNYVVLEKGALVNSIYNYPLYMSFFSTAERLEIGNIPFMSLQPKPGRQEAMEYYRRVASVFNLNIKLYEPVASVQKLQDESFHIVSSKSSYQASSVIIATGFYDIPVMLNVPGEYLPKVSHYYKDPHAYAMQRVIVVGASNSAVDAALETWRRGAEVTMVVRQSAIGERVKYWVRPDIENRIAEGSIKAYFDSSLLAIREDEVDISTPEGPVTLKNDFVLALTGYRPDFEWLKKCGIDFSNDVLHKPCYKESTMETNIPDLYLAGVVCGGMETHKWFIENSRVHASMILAAIVAKRKKAI